MKTIFPLKQSVLITTCLSILFFLSCSKSSDSPADPGYGCNTQAILQTIPPTAAKLVYVPAQSKWLISLDLSGSIYIACEACGNADVLSAITTGHSLTDVININVSGNIKKREVNQAAPAPGNTGYREIYLMDINSVNQ
jgi:hypothetical protein